MRKKIKIKSKKGFTLIELLMMVAIIGILASIVLVNLGGVRKKTNDASLVSSAESIMKAAIADAANTKDYTPYYATAKYIENADDCNANFNSVSKPSEIKAACINIMDKIGNTDSLNLAAGKMFMHSWGTPTYPRLSIMVWLPGIEKYYCIGSNGGVSKATNEDGTGCVNLLNCPGCAGDNTANGS